MARTTKHDREMTARVEILNRVAECAWDALAEHEVRNKPAHVTMLRLKALQDELRKHDSDRLNRHIATAPRL